ncbi:IMS-domain-containing protein [Moesziomyces antarcticus]|uniref:DNA polymerase kappa n=1 Tax=Pseudozyma antarctica TaxID=84753 RepID=A0A5C3FFY8_PSEA2|nr:IMS-domain-containing protein [Moesziomyces antarcticus]GAK63202.1 IMS-domain-containing protein [Moesziomyces antarcticus]SPO43314.1 related to DNA polymerase kappa [Moesziomyces antarcticus]
MNFFRDRDANTDVFDDPNNDPTAPSPSTSPRKRQRTSPPASASASASTSSRTQDAAGDDDALASLRKRMAGPSSAKAGLAKDQDEINRIIYEVSKGSKFFDNERKKDAQTTERINALLARRDQKLLQVPPGSPEWLSIERKINDMAMRHEDTRDLSRTILHTDIDMFYAAVELARDPSLKGKCFGVGSGVLVTASYEARRGYGVRSGMAVFVAKALCPHLIVVKNDMQSYVTASHKVMAVFERYDDNLAQASLDEAYLDITEYLEQHGGSIDEVVQQLRDEVRNETQLTVSVGIAPNTMLAKISSDRNKPDGQFRVHPDRKTIVDFMRDLPCRKIPGIGRVNERILESLGVNTCGDIWHNRVQLWLALDGKIDWLIKAHLGIGNTVVEPSKREQRKSVGREHTFSPTSDIQSLLDLLKESAQRVQNDLERLDFKGKTVTLVAKRDNYQRFSRARTSTRLVHTAEELYEITSSLLLQEIERQGPLSLRLIGVRVTHLVDLRSAAAGEQRLRKLFQARAADAAPTDIPPEGSRTDGRKTAKEWHDEEERQLALAIKRSLEGQADPFSDVQDLSQDEPAPAHPDDTLRESPSTSVEDTSATSTSRAEAEGGVKCPVCGTRITGTNVQLNAHIDECLNPPRVATPQPGKRRKGPLDSFVRRSN